MEIIGITCSLETMKITQVIIQRSFSSLIEVMEMKRTQLFSFLFLFLFFFLNKSDCCGREGGAEKIYFFLFSKVHLI